MWKECETLQQIATGEYLKKHVSNKVNLTEKATNAELNSIWINNLDEQGITLRLCAGKDSFFIKNTGNARCDYVVLSTVGKNKIALFIDLKSKHLKNIDCLEQIPHKGDGRDGEKYPDVVYQLKASSCYFEYLDHVLKDFCGYTSLSNDYPPNTNRAFVVFHCKELAPSIAGNITQTRPRTSKNNTPETALILKANNGQTFDFKSLII